MGTPSSLLGLTTRFDWPQPYIKVIDIRLNFFRNLAFILKTHLS